MGKVKLTRGQAEAIEDIKGTMHLNLEANLKEQINKEWYGYPFGSLNKLTTKQFLDALYIGYEVEQEVKVGDFVDIGLFGTCKIAEVTGVKGDAIAINGSDEYHKFKIHKILTDEEKQEEKQRRWWKSHGREPWELKEKDLLIKRKFGAVAFEVREVRKSIVVMSNGGSTDIGNIMQNYKIVCFAEDRKDVDHA